MPEVLETNQTQTFPPAQMEIYYPSSRSEEEIIYPEQREDDMGESSYHNNLRVDLFLVLNLFFSKRTNVFMTANMNVYYVQGNSDKWFAPDILVAFGVPNYDRSIYKVWQEKVFPQVIFEIASDRTWKTDVDEKLKLYERLGAEEYYVFDAEFAYLPAPLMAFHRQGERLVKKQITNDRVFSPRLGLEIVMTENTFRLFNPQTNEFLRTLEESEAERHKIASELERLKAEIERLKAEK